MMASWRADWQAHATWWDQAHIARLWTCGTYGPAWSFGLHMRVGCTRWEGTSCDPCIVTRGSGAAFLFTPEAAGAAPAGAAVFFFALSFISGHTCQSFGKLAFGNFDYC